MPIMPGIIAKSSLFNVSRACEGFLPSCTHGTGGELRRFDGEKRRVDTMDYGQG